MNLFELIRRKDRNALVRGEVKAVTKALNGRKWFGVSLASGSEVRIPNASRFFTLRGWPDFCGWHSHGSSLSPDLEVGFALQGTEALISSTEIRSGTRLVPLFLNWPKSGELAVDLVIRTTKAEEPSDTVFVATSRALSRDWLYALAKGRGVEIGPGPVPQILPADDVQVSYVEQMPPAEWSRLYNQGGKYPENPELWDSYVVGDACDLPVDDKSLNFIFGSHVFEHLANPYGHLQRWHHKLKSGGRILCVIPDLSGTKDAVQKPSTPAEWASEFERAIWEPTIDHYVRHMHRKADDPRLQKAISDKESIHVHYYTNSNCRELMDWACAEGGFAKFSLNWTANTKDFHFMLQKA
ncbi:class I SAM-dependent methyltransferase [Chenggangzhangella methanolivorans]|uniref:Class I SAM-dependent methyltransferase n=1 Tax=Chenggangzhangella methanolivorans TaxID=1437009 RepID=A0A9E6R5C6_9HYPH|nr:class I SAM-dependent methyltransferase [Chenggangzhangella methanolivorans]QZN98492.1 class I SAM-dependent methyltransferase [Chenggangzhangella methanolivorans]